MTRLIRKYGSQPVQEDKSTDRVDVDGHVSHLPIAHPIHRGIAFGLSEEEPAVCWQVGAGSLWSRDPVLAKGNRLQRRRVFPLTEADSLL